MLNAIVVTFLFFEAWASSWTEQSAAIRVRETVIAEDAVANAMLHPGGEFEKERL
ncbi:MAG: hypothetical protein ABFS02_06585 [Pseudomonadota bacterium]